MADYLLVPKHRQDRLVHEKARTRAGQPLYWLRSYMVDVLEDQELIGETPFVRFVSILVEHLAASSGWKVLDDPRRLAGRFGVSPKHLKPALARLVEIGRLHRLTEAVVLEGGGLQMRLSPSDYAGLEGPFPQPGDNQPIRNESRTDPERIPVESGTDPGDSRSHAASVAESASRSLAQSRAEQKGLELKGKATPREDPADAHVSTETETPALPITSTPSNPLLIRLIGLACKGEKASASLIRYEAQGLPDHALARCIEALITRRPRPRNPAGYVVQTLRGIRDELGLARPAVAADREPEIPPRG